MKYTHIGKPQGLLFFRSLADAARNGFEVSNKGTEGFLVPVRTAAGWKIAFIESAGTACTNNVQFEGA